jgi:hypothetical protein
VPFPFSTNETIPSQGDLLVNGIATSAWFGEGESEPMNHFDLNIVRLRAASAANAVDAGVWRWYSDLMEDDRLKCIKMTQGWVVEIDGVCTVHDRSFDCAIRRACDSFPDVNRCHSNIASNRRRRSSLNDDKQY